MSSTWATLRLSSPRATRCHSSRCRCALPLLRAVGASVFPSAPLQRLEQRLLLISRDMSHLYGESIVLFLPSTVSAMNCTEKHQWTSDG